MKSNVRQINIRCSNESKTKVDQLCRDLKITQSQLIEKLIENYQQKPCTENNDQIAELEGNYQELVKVVKLKELEIEELRLAMAGFSPLAGIR
ncbi:MAG: RepB family protein, partial [Sphaerospermopsis kisseleviana]